MVNTIIIPYMPNLPVNAENALQRLKPEELKEDLARMVLIRNFETRAESAYLAGKVGGFFHSYTGQEAIQTAILRVFGPNHWYTTSYRCHALALLLGATPDELMAELYGKAAGNAQGRGGSMHFYTDQLLGGFGIVGGQIPVATGAGFTCKYLDQKGKFSLCFMGEGAVAQGAFHEALNMAALWSLPCLYVIENNQWGMGTAVNRAISVNPIAELKAPGYGMAGYTIDGMDYLHCIEAFTQIKEEMVRTGKPVLVEALTERFKGHSISDPANYRTKEALSACMQKDPILQLKAQLVKKKLITEEQFEQLDKEKKEIAVAAMKYAESCPWPDPASLEEGVFAP